GSATVTSSTPTTAPPPADNGLVTIQPGVLTVGTESVTAPWYTATDSSDPTTINGGFEYDLARSIAARLGLSSVRIVVTPLVDVLSAQACACDVMFDEILVTDNRARRADFTEPYLTVDQGVLVRKGTTLSTVVEGRQLRWGVALENASGLDLLTKRIKPNVAPQVVVDQQDALARLEDGRLDAVLLPTPDALARAEVDTSVTVAGQLRTSDLYAGVLALGSPNTALLNDAIRDMRDDGTIALFLRHYFGVDPSDVPVIPS